MKAFERVWVVVELGVVVEVVWVHGMVVVAAALLLGLEVSGVVTAGA